MSDKEKEVFEECVKELFRRAGIRHYKRLGKQERWFERYSWTEAEAADFKKWMVAHMRKRCRWRKKIAEKEAGWFMLQYSWRSVPRGTLKVEDGR